MKPYLIVIDMQNDFIDGALGTPEAQAMLPRAVERIRSFRNGLHSARPAGAADTWPDTFDTP